MEPEVEELDQELERLHDATQAHQVDRDLRRKEGDAPRGPVRPGHGTTRTPGRGEDGARDGGGGGGLGPGRLVDLEVEPLRDGVEPVASVRQAEGVSVSVVEEERDPSPLTPLSSRPVPRAA